MQKNADKAAVSPFRCGWSGAVVLAVELGVCGAESREPGAGCRGLWSCTWSRCKASCSRRQNARLADRTPRASRWKCSRVSGITRVGIKFYTAQAENANSQWPKILKYLNGFGQMVGHSCLWPAAAVRVADAIENVPRLLPVFARFCFVFLANTLLS